jgi:hypothetical protein
LLLLPATPLATGCIIPEPEQSSPQRSPIYVVASSIQPSPTGVLVISTVPPVTTVNLSFTIYAEDAGVAAHSALFLDYNHPGSTWITENTWGIGTLSEPRLVHDVLTGEERRLTPGCHALSQLVFHEDDWDDQHKQIIGNPPELAMVTWVVDIQDGAGSNPLSGCPSISMQTASP